MTSQIRAATFAFLAGLAISLLLQAPGVIGADDVKLFDPSNLVNAEFLGYWTGRLAVVPLIFVVIAIVATARKAGRGSSIVAGLVAVVLVTGVSFAITWGVVAGAAMPQLMKEFPYADPGIARDFFVKGASGSCAKKQNTLPENKDISAAAIDAYCSCFSGSLADVITKDEIESLGRHEAPGPGFAEKARTASQKCSRLAEDKQ